MVGVRPAVPISVYGGATGSTLAWRHRGELRLTVVVKAAFALSHDSLAELLPGCELWSEETAEHPADLVPALPRPEVILVGHAYAPSGMTVSSLAVRLFVGGDAPAVDKTLHVYGDRQGGRGAPAPFSSIPLTYARAVGGPGTENPAGRRPDDPRAYPNVVDPSNPWSPAGLGPIRADWPARRRAVRSRAPFEVDGLLEVPDDLALEYFQAAPPDQRVDGIAGDEWVVVDGMHPTWTRFQSQLPGLIARARLTAANDPRASTAIDLHADRLFIDMDRLVATLTWRGGCAMPSASSACHVVAGVEGVEEAGMEESSQTMVVDDAELARLAGGAPLPWADAAARRSSPGKALGGLPFGQLDRPAPPPSAFDWSNDETVTIAGADVGAALPFAAGTAPAPPRSIPRIDSLEEDDDEAGQTAVAEIPKAFREALPFAAEPSEPKKVAPSHGPSALPPSLLARAEASAEPEPAEPPAPAPPPAASEPAPVREEIADAVSMTKPSAIPIAEPAPDAPVAALSEAEKVREHVIARVRAGEALFGASLSGADLSELDLRGARLTDADLSAAKLTNTDLSSAKLSGAKLVGADLSGAKLGGADLSRAELVRAVLDGADLEGADLSGASLTLASGEGARFGRARCERAAFGQGKWTRAVFDAAAMTGADLSGARVDNASFRGADLANATLSELSGEDVDLKDAKLEGANAAGARLPGVDLSGASADRSIWEGAEIDRGCLDGCSMRGASLARASMMATTARKAVLDDADISNATAEGIDLAEASLARALLRQTKLAGAKLSGASLKQANLQRVVATETDFQGADLSGASLRVAKLRGANLAGALVEGADLRDANLVGARLSGVDRSKAKLAGANLKDVVE